MPYIIAVHMKQATTMLLFVLPFTLVDALGIKMVPLMTFIAIIYMGRPLTMYRLNVRYRRYRSPGRTAFRNVSQSVDRAIVG